MNQSSSAELYDFPDDFCLDIPNVNNPHRTLDETSDIVSRTAIFKSAVSRNNTNFDPKWQVAATDLQAAIKQASDQAAKKWLVEHGYGDGHDCRLRVHSEPRVSVKPTAGSGNAFNAIIQTLLTQEGALQTQASVRSKVQAMCPTVPVTKNWNQPLPSWAINKVMARVACLGSPFDTIKLKKRATLNDLHAASKTAVEKFQGKAQKFEPEVLLSDTQLIINGVPFAISRNKSGGKEYSCVRVNTTKLQEALAKR